MTDKELLELAAKAAGFLNWTATEPAGLHIETGSRRGDTGFYWNPLEDDGDALRLAVNLRLDISVNLDFVQVWAADFNVREANNDPYAATRRAIVRAAAAIAKAEEQA